MGSGSESGALIGSEGRVEWRRLGAPTRREVFRLAATGQRHPDTDVAEAAATWAYAPGWNRLANRIPGWILPALGVLIGAVFIVVHLPLMCIAAGVVVVFGLLGWFSATAARRLRRIYRPPAPAGDS